MKTPFILLSVICILVACGNPPQEQEEETPPPYPVNKVVLSYLASPRLSMPDFKEQILGEDISLEEIDWRTGLVFFALPGKDSAQDSTLLASISMYPDSADTWRSAMALDRREASRDTNPVMVQMKIAHFKVDETQVVTQTIGDYTYQLSLKELRDIGKAMTLYDSPAIFVWNGPRGRTSIANHMAPIAKPDEPTLIPLVNQLAPDSLTPKARAQALLTFVTDEIAYEDHGRYEIFMKPHETILSGQSDCSGKVVLYASFLEQIGYPYLLLYMQGHICLAIPGDFPESNEMSFEHEGTKYYMAETTVPGFIIGETRTIPSLGEADIEFIQEPGYDTKLFEVSTQDSLGFLTIEVPAS